MKSRSKKFTEKIRVAPFRSKENLTRERRVSIRAANAIFFLSLGCSGAINGPVTLYLLEGELARGGS